MYVKFVTPISKNGIAIVQCRRSLPKCFCATNQIATIRYQKTAGTFALLACARRVACVIQYVLFFVWGSRIGPGEGGAGRGRRETCTQGFRENPRGDGTIK